MLTERAVSFIGIILGSSLVAVAVAGELSDCQTRIQREGPKDLTYWSWRTIDGRQCWYRGDRWKPKEELRWADTVPPAASGTVGEVRANRSLRWTWPTPIRARHRANRSR